MDFANNQNLKKEKRKIKPFSKQVHTKHNENHFETNKSTASIDIDEFQHKKDDFAINKNDQKNKENDNETYSQNDTQITRKEKDSYDYLEK